MLSVANSALDLLVLELVLHGLGIGILALVLGILAPVGRWLEDDVLANGCRIGCGTSTILGRSSKLGPALAIGDAGVDNLAMGDEANATGRLHLLVLVVDVILDDGRAAILVGDLLGGRELVGGLLGVDVVGPVMSGKR